MPGSEVNPAQDKDDLLLSFAATCWGMFGLRQKSRIEGEERLRTVNPRTTTGADHG